MDYREAESKVKDICYKYEREAENLMGYKDTIKMGNEYFLKDYNNIYFSNKKTTWYGVLFVSLLVPIVIFVILSFLFDNYFWVISICCGVFEILPFAYGFSEVQCEDSYNTFWYDYNWERVRKKPMDEQIEIYKAIIHKLKPKVEQEEQEKAFKEEIKREEDLYKYSKIIAEEEL